MLITLSVVTAQGYRNTVGGFRVPRFLSLQVFTLSVPFQNSSERGTECPEQGTSPRPDASPNTRQIQATETCSLFSSQGTTAFCEPRLSFPFGRLSHWLENEDSSL